ncbi:MAG: histidine kinase [Lachnospiraceae bacterium]|nr:histidine kinase [Lachnospiraceae bacterium]
MRFLVKLLNRISIKRKLLIIFLFCVILPMIFTDAVVMYIMVSTAARDDMDMMQNVVDSAKYTIRDYCDTGYNLMLRISENKNVNLASVVPYNSNLDYYIKYFELSKNKLFSNGRSIVTIYPENENIINGGNFQRRSKITDTEWYRQFEAFNRKTIPYVDPSDTYIYVDYTKVNWEEKRVFSMICDYDFYEESNGITGNNIIKVDLNYSSIVQAIENAKYGTSLYICLDDKIIFSNDKKGGLHADFSRISEIDADAVGLKERIKLYDKQFDIYVLKNENVTWTAIRENWFLVVALLGLNVFFPMVTFLLLNKSFTERLSVLSKSFASEANESLITIPEVDGTDDISTLMHAYNDMATRINNLIETEYKERLKRQEVDIAKQRAELEALHSQINPHFLFNALESIRMHSVLKQENETARMVEKLAMMQRQNVEWGNDYVSVANEIRLVEAYLELQKYRFGNKLMYEVSVDDDCRDIRVPKITLVTFVENACVHSMEKKTSVCWIFVRVSREYDTLVLEVEDTGNGIPEDACRQLVEDMRNVDIEMIRGKKSIGILNAALRLKMFTEQRAVFDIESESGVGTLITIKMPIIGENKVYGGIEDA